MTVAEAMEKYLKKCRVRNLAAKTIEGYQSNMLSFAKFYVGELEDLQQDDIDDYVLELQDSGINTTTVNNKLRDLRAFLNFYKTSRVVDKEIKITLINVNESEIMPLEPGQLKDLYDVCLMGEKYVYYNGKGFCHYRDYVLMRILEETGMRISEVLRLQVRDVDVNKQTINIRQTKNKKARVTYFTRTLLQEMKKYLELRQQFLYNKRLAGTSLFVNNQGQPLQVRSIQQNITRYGEKAEIQGVRVSPHTFRHTFAKNYLMNGGDIFTLQDLLGHSSLEMVRRYARLFSAQRQIQYQHVMEKYTRSKKNFAK